MERPGDATAQIGGFHVNNPIHVQFWNDVLALANSKLAKMHKQTAAGDCAGMVFDTRIRLVATMQNIEDPYYWNNQNGYLNTTAAQVADCSNPLNITCDGANWYVLPLHASLNNAVDACHKAINVFFTENQTQYDNANNGLPFDRCKTSSAMLPGLPTATPPPNPDLRIHMVDQWLHYMEGVNYANASATDSYVWNDNDYTDENNPRTWIVRTKVNLLLHELFHCFNLKHTNTWPYWPFPEYQCNIMCNVCSETSVLSITDAQLSVVYQSFAAAKTRIYIEGCPYNPARPFVVNSNQTWQDDIRLYQDLVVQSGNTLTLKCKLQMPPDSRIVVERGAKLIVDGGIINKSDCDCGRWQGIEVWGNTAVEHASVLPSANPATLAPADYINATLTPTDPGIVVLHNGTTIQNARTAITTQRRGGYFPDYYGGIICAENSSFLNNRCAAEFMQYKPQNLSQFRFCEFSSNVPIPRPYLTMWDTHGIYLTDNNFNGNNSPTVNETAIYSIDAGYNLAVSNVFKDLTMGVCATSGGVGAFLQIGNPGAADYNPTLANRFENCRIGLYMAGMFESKVKSNYFYNCQVSAYNDGSEGVFTEYNLFEHPNTANTHTNVLYLNTGSRESHIRNNTFVNSYNSIFAWLANRGLRIKCNQNLQTAYNLVVSGDISGTGVSGAIYTEQGTMDNNSNAPASNKFGAYFNPSTHIHTQGNTILFNYVHHKNMVYVPIYDAGANYTKQEHPTYYNEVCFPDDVVEGCPNPPCADFIEDIKTEIEALKNLLNQFTEGSYAHNSLSKDIEYLTSKLDAAVSGSVTHYEKSDSLDKALQILANADTENARRQKVRLLIAHERFADAQTALDNLPLATQEDQQFAALQQIQRDLRSQNQTYKDLTAAQLSALANIATTQTTQSVYARSILHFVQDAPFNPDMPVILPASGKTNPTVANKMLSLLTLAPNPTTDEVFVGYQGTTKSNLQVVLYSISGKEQMRQNMLYGNARLHTHHLPNGLYLCIVQNEAGAIIAQEKLSIVR